MGRALVILVEHELALLVDNDQDHHLPIPFLKKAGESLACWLLMAGGSVAQHLKER